MNFPIPSLLLALAAALATASQTLQAEALPKGKRLADYLSHALEHHPGLKAAREQVEAAAQRVPQARSLPDPMLSYSHGLDTGDMNRENMVTFSQAIPWMGKLRLSGAIASREAEVAALAYENQRLDLIRRLSAAFFAYAALGKEAGITAETLELLAGIEDSVEAKVRAGGDYSQKLRLDVERGRIRDRTLSLERERARASASLAALLGATPGGAPLPWPDLDEGALPPVDGTRLRQQVLEENPVLLALESERLAAADRTRLARLSPLPDPEIGATWTQMRDQNEDMAGVMIGFRLPLWFGKYKAERLEAEAKERAAGLALEDGKNQLLEAFARAMETLGESAARVSLHRDELLPAARQALEVTETSYRADQATLLDLTDSERVLLELQTTYWKVLAEAQASLIELQTYAGQSTLPSSAAK